MKGIEGRAEFVEKLNKLVDDNHHDLYLIDGVFDGVKSIKKSIREYESKNVVMVGAGVQLETGGKKIFGFSEMSHQSYSQKEALGSITRKFCQL
tara:strand:+ start:314 stop:595 length:282 start_codon:yes stop_codon:yes gene_type:complete